MKYSTPQSKKNQSKYFLPKLFKIYANIDHKILKVKIFFSFIYKQSVPIFIHIRKFQDIDFIFQCGFVLVIYRS